jgi:hypothetical protein
MRDEPWGTHVERPEDPEDAYLVYARPGFADHPGRSRSNAE